MKVNSAIIGQWLKKAASNLGVKIACLYLLLPMLIFLAGWVRWYIAAPGICILLYCFYTLCKHAPVLWRPEWNRQTLEKLFLIVGITFLWVYLSGIGGFVAQNTDHSCRNSIFEMLVHKQWPVRGIVDINGVSAERGLVYYIGYWLPAAVIGKLLGTNAGYCMQALWAVVGILLFYYFICAVRKKLSVWPLLIFIFFSGLDAAGYFFTRVDLSAWNRMLHLEWWASAFQFSSFTTQLFWVFNQALPVWLIVMLLYVQQSNRHMVFLLGLSMLSSALPFIGLIPFCIYFIFSRKYDCSLGHCGLCLRKEWWRAFLQDTFTFENILGGGIAGILSFLYLKGNISGQIVGTGSQTGEIRGYLLLYILFILLEVGVYFLAIYKYWRNKALYYLAIVWLCICPLITVGFGKDFGMRASIPALVLLYLMVIKTLSSSKRARDYGIYISLSVLLFLGSITSVHEIVRTTAITAERYRSGQPILDVNVTEEELLQSRNFAGEVEGSFFYQYIAR